MKSFLKKLILFSSILLALSIIFFIVLNYGNNQALRKYRVNRDVKTIFIGDSHVKLAIDDKQLPNTVNLSQLSESYKFSFLKLQSILQTNPSISKVYVGFSYNNLSSGYDDFIYGKSSRDILANYFFLFPFKEKTEILKLHSDELFTFLRMILFNGLRNLFANEKNLTFLGHYENDFKKASATKSSMDKRLLFQYYEKGKPRGFSSTNLYYLQKIMELCKDRHVEAILLGTPLHPYYQSKIPSTFVEKYNALISENHWKLVDLNHLVFDDSCFIPDGDHVSVKGASLTAKELNKQINADR